MVASVQTSCESATVELEAPCNCVVHTACTLSCMTLEYPLLQQPWSIMYCMAVHALINYNWVNTYMGVLTMFSI